MPSSIPQIVPIGVRPQFTRVKDYLKSYKRGFDDEQYQRKLNNLQRYAAEGEGFVDGEYDGEPIIFNFSGAVFEMMGVYWVTRWLAVQGALRGVADWSIHWRRSAAYGHWGYRMELEKEMDGYPRTIKHNVFNIANCLVLGWQEWAIQHAKQIYLGLDRRGVFYNKRDRMFIDYNETWHPRTQVFILRLIADWQGWPKRSWEKWVLDEPIFNALIEHWRTPNVGALKSLLLAACDRHTHESRSGGSSKYDMEKVGFWYDPFEIVAVMKLRQLHGLENPVLDHLLMNTPLGKLPDPTPLYTDDLLDGGVPRIRPTPPDF